MSRLLPSMLVVQVRTADVTMRASIPRWAVREVVRFVVRLAGATEWIVQRLLRHHLLRHHLLRKRDRDRWVRLLDLLREARQLRMASIELPKGEPYVDVQTSRLHLFVGDVPLSWHALPVVRRRRTHRVSPPPSTDWRST